MSTTSRRPSAHDGSLLLNDKNVCHFCKNLDWGLCIGVRSNENEDSNSESGDLDEINWRNLDEFDRASENCIICRQIFLSFDEKFPGYIADLSRSKSTILINYTFLAPNFALPILSTLRVYLSEGREPTSNSRPPEIKKKELLFRLNYESWPSVARYLGSSTAPALPRKQNSCVDISLLLKWKGICDTHPLVQCKWTTLLEKLPKIHLRLIDLHRLCLITGTTDYEFAALSYVWGHRISDDLRLETANSSYMYEEGSLSQNIPKTIQDALYVARAIGFRYLFVDRLCIIQDDESDTNLYVDAMHLIFGRASVTLVAAAGDCAADGLPGATDNSPRESKTFQELQLKEDITLRQITRNELSTRKCIESAIRSSSWRSRGWTLQEESISRRLLIFAQDQICWSCDQCAFTDLISYEDAHILPVGSLGGSTMSSELTNPRSTAGYDHRTLIENYKLRKLTFPEDVLRALTGLLNLFSLRHDPWEFTYGLSQESLPIDLLWGCMCCMRGAGHVHSIHETHHVEQLKLSKSNSCTFPSWSWSSWQGAIGWHGSLKSKRKESALHFDQGGFSRSIWAASVSREERMSLKCIYVGSSISSSKMPTIPPSLMSKLTGKELIFEAECMPCSLGSASLLSVENNLLWLPFDLEVNSDSRLNSPRSRWLQCPAFDIEASRCDGGKLYAIYMGFQVMMVASREDVYFKRRGLLLCSPEDFMSIQPMLELKLIVLA